MELTVDPSIHDLLLSFSPRWIRVDQQARSALSFD
jgi:hypothetical protein